MAPSAALPSRGHHVATNSTFLSLYLCTLTATGVALFSTRHLHWFLAPVLFCGVIIGTDAIDWLRGRVDLFDPIGIIGVIGFHFFFLAPILHVHWDYWMPYIIPPEDWRPWLGGMALLNALGLLIYRSTRRRFTERTRVAWYRPAWRLNPHKLSILAAAILLLTGALQAWVYVKMGGIQGYITAFTDTPGAFRGMGWVFLLSESFPMVAWIALSSELRRRGLSHSGALHFAALLAFLFLALLFGGLRGSRSNTVWALFWAVGIVHLWLRPISKRAVVLGLVFLIGFMYLYGFYKSFGVETLSAFSGTERLSALSRETGRTLEATILADLARSDVQAFLLYRFTTQSDDLDYAWGRTYLGTIALLIPRSLWPDRPPNKVKDGTNALYGKDSYIPGEFESARVYGLAGEAMLNFGPLAVPFSFAFLGLAVGWLHRLGQRLRREDSRRLLYPFLVTIAFAFMVSDSDNVVFLLVKNGTIPLFVIATCSYRVRVRPEHFRYRPRSDVCRKSMSLAEGIDSP